MANRFILRNNYIEGWYQLNGKMLLASTTSDFIFEDPAEPSTITQIQLVDYMQRWDKRMRAAGANNEWRLDHEVRQDKNGILTDWEWWEVLNTSIRGMAMVQTNDEGVFYECITYFNRE